jgi:hypothetical protein
MFKSCILWLWWIGIVGDYSHFDSYWKMQQKLVFLLHQSIDRSPLILWIDWYTLECWKNRFFKPWIDSQTPSGSVNRLIQCKRVKIFIFSTIMDPFASLLSNLIGEWNHTIFYHLKTLVLCLNWSWKDFT